MGRYNSSNIGNMLEELINDAVETAINETDFEDKINDTLPNFEDMIERAVDNIDIDDKVNDAVSEALDEYDISEKVEKEVEAELTAHLHEYVENEFDSFSKTDKFKELVMAEVNRVLDAREAAKRAKLVDYVKFGPLRRWVAAWGSWY